MTDIEMSDTAKELLCFIGDRYGTKPFNGDEAIAELMSWKKEHPNLTYVDYVQIEAL